MFFLRWDFLLLVIRADHNLWILIWGLICSLWALIIEFEIKVCVAQIHTIERVFFDHWVLIWWRRIAGLMISLLLPATLLSLLSEIVHRCWRWYYAITSVYRPERSFTQVLTCPRLNLKQDRPRINVYFCILLLINIMWRDRFLLWFLLLFLLQFFDWLTSLRTYKRGLSPSKDTFHGWSGSSVLWTKNLFLGWCWLKRLLVYLLYVVVSKR